VVSFVVFHKRGFSVLTGRFIRGVLLAYELQLQHLNPNNIQQMAAFEAMCDRRPLAPVPVLLQVHLPEGWLSWGDDRLRQSSDEARP
jgi:hypothetical protein